MINKQFIFALLPLSLTANATCLMDSPEIGDIGPGSELVCNEFALRYPDAELAVVGRAIHSPTEVSVFGLVDGGEVSFVYRLSGFNWRLEETGEGTADAPVAQVGLPRMQ